MKSRVDRSQVDKSQVDLAQISEGFAASTQCSRRDAFLRRLRSAGKYKRYSGAPLRYAGGKSRAVGHILERFPDDLPLLVSPFFGGGSVEIAAARELGVEVRGYDVFAILVNFWQVVLRDPGGLAAMLTDYPPTKAHYRAIKTRLKQHWEDEAKIDDPSELAAHYWFNHNLSYGPGFLGWMSTIYSCPKRYERLVDKLRQFECPLLSVDHGSFAQTIPSHRHDFLYCDPPYYLEDGKMFRGIYPQRNFPVHHKGFDHLLLSRLLKEHRGGFVLSYNDCRTIRELYSAFKIVEVRWQYTLGQGETRIGKNRRESGTDHVKKSHEILIIHHAQTHREKRDDLPKKRAPSQGVRTAKEDLFCEKARDSSSVLDSRRT